MRDYGAFGEVGVEPAALLVECGQHWEASAANLAKAATARFLAATGLAGPDFPAEAPWPECEQTLLEVTDAVTVETDAFEFARPFTGGETLAAGALIGRDGAREIRAPYDGCVLIMPTKRLWPGQTAVRLARKTR
jgi:predicted deacylase